MGESLLDASHAALEEIAREVGTPVYVYSAAAIRRQYRALEQALAGIPHRLFYSVKANSNLAILDLVRSLGAGADIVSAGELARVLRAGFAPQDVVFSGVGKTRHELDLSLEHGVGLINVESRGELERLSALAEARGTVARFGIRVNPNVRTSTHPYTQTGERGMKFGVPLEDVEPLTEWAGTQASLTLRCLGMHIGSQITDAGHYREGATRLADLVQRLGGAARHLEVISVGGGLGIRYTDETPLEPVAFVDAVRPLWERARVPLAIEPGRFLVGNAGCLLTRCTYAKQTGGREVLVVDAGMNDLLRPSLYGARHGIRVVVPAPEGGRVSRVGVSGTVDVVGPLCESADAFASGIALPGAGPGALLGVLGAGAYAFSMSSTYNSRPRGAEVLVDGEGWSVIRDRETIDDLMRGERLPTLGDATARMEMEHHE